MSSKGGIVVKEKRQRFKTLLENGIFMPNMNLILHVLKECSMPSTKLLRSATNGRVSKTISCGSTLAGSFSATDDSCIDY